MSSTILPVGRRFIQNDPNQRASNHAVLTIGHGGAGGSQMVYDPKLRDDGQVIMDKGELENYGAQWLTPLLAGEIRSSYAVTERRVRRHQPVSLDVKVHERADERPAASHGGTT